MSWLSDRASDFGNSVTGAVKSVGAELGRGANKVVDATGDVVSGVVVKPIQYGLGFAGDFTDTLGLGSRAFDSLSDTAGRTSDATENYFDRLGDASSSAFEGDISEAGREFDSSTHDYLRDPGVQMAIQMAATMGGAGPAISYIASSLRVPTSVAAGIYQAGVTGLQGGDEREALAAGLTAGTMQGLIGPGSPEPGLQAPQGGFNPTGSGQGFNSNSLNQSMFGGGSSLELANSPIIDDYGIGPSLRAPDSFRPSVAPVGGLERFGRSAARGAVSNLGGQLGRGDDVDLGRVAESGLSGGAGGLYGGLGSIAAQAAIQRSKGELALDED